MTLSCDLPGHGVVGAVVGVVGVGRHPRPRQELAGLEETVRRRSGGGQQVWLHIHFSHNEDTDVERVTIIFFLKPATKC